MNSSLGGGGVKNFAASRKVLRPLATFVPGKHAMSLRTCLPAPRRKLSGRKQSERKMLRWPANQPAACVSCATSRRNYCVGGCLIERFVQSVKRLLARRRRRRLFAWRPLCGGGGGLLMETLALRAARDQFSRRAALSRALSRRGPNQMAAFSLPTKVSPRSFSVNNRLGLRAQPYNHQNGLLCRVVVGGGVGYYRLH